jgi:hypothetical protein
MKKKPYMVLLLQGCILSKFGKQDLNLLIFCHHCLYNAPINVNPEGGGGSGKGWGIYQSGGPMGRDLD